MGLKNFLQIAEKYQRHTPYLDEFISLEDISYKFTKWDYLKNRLKRLINWRLKFYNKLD